MGATVFKGRSISSRSAETACEAFATRRLRAQAPELTRRAGAVHRLLVNTSLRAPRGPAVRAPALTPDGTPVAWSVSVGGSRAAAPLRLVTEPGGLTLTISEQVTVARAAASAGLDVLGWTRAGPALDAALTALLTGAADLATWWGGMWVGMSAGTCGLRLRVYLNLRNGDVRSRWQRLTRLATRLGVTGLARVAAHAARFGQPVGACVVVSRGRVAGFRVYVALRRTDRASTRAAAGLPGFSGEPAVSFLDGFSQAFTAPPPDAATIAYDFVAGGGVVRVKTELCCELLPAAYNAQVLGWLAAWLHDHHRPTAELEAFEDDFVSCLGALAVQYVTVGVRAGLDHVSAYCRPTTIVPTAQGAYR